MQKKEDINSLEYDKIPTTNQRDEEETKKDEE